MERLIGRVSRVTGPVVYISDVSDAMMMELVHVGRDRIIGEVVKLDGSTAVIQVYESSVGLSPGDEVFGEGMPLSVELAPGLIGSIYDGIQRPLQALEAASGAFMDRGISAPAVSYEKEWSFTPSIEEGVEVIAGMILGEVPETSSVIHHIMVPLQIRGKATVLSIKPAGQYKISTVIAIIQDEQGQQHELTMVQRWSIRQPRPVERRLPLEVPLITGQRVIDTLFPLAKGGAVALPGPFGAGKTMTQHAVAKWCDADIIVYIGCGERGNEMTDVLNEFPHLIDPRTGKSLMERTILIANTSNMPVSAREASVYTGVTIAEYYRDMGYHVAIMADSTSRWAEAMRELSGRMEEMPAEEGFPAYLPTRIAAFYERAGMMQNLNHTQGSVTIIGAVSPPGGDFSEPVTQHTKRFVRAFWALDRSLAYARHFPSVSWIDSYSEYSPDLEPWWHEKMGEDFTKNRNIMVDLLLREEKLQQVVKLVGPDALPESQQFILEVCTMFKNAFLQQSAFDTVDQYSTLEKQAKMMYLLVLYWNNGRQAIRKGVHLSSIRQLEAVRALVRMKLTIANDQLALFDTMEQELIQAITKLEARNE
ncbi:V-type ATP synthase subunit A [Entomospira nematocerorum]|uniref:V-type ATP synthase alpha chain n=1 Tax=Entomospira nematocerorum TaxID=2719987 RepID=A0A968GH59_9SPIO|nr:V-type ATP synthase subunit A [Entomospira nematocera]NIZ47061.1 V-type ATP synthase subunit A [Entomospira nematocera]WDI34394.1 V-type ATP synthase subunit A [Entomospira nematocera]